MKVKVVKAFKTKKGDLHRKFKKDKAGLYLLDKEGAKQSNVIDLDDSDAKAALKIKAVELVD